MWSKDLCWDLLLLQRKTGSHCSVVVFCVAFTRRARLFFCCCFLSDFSNVISKSDVKSLAEADEQEVVAEVQVNFEYFK